MSDLESFDNTQDKLVEGESATWEKRSKVSI